jgi:hypothetical protein
MWFFRPFNTKSWVLEVGGFSLPGVLVGVGLLGVSAVVISNTVVDARRSQQVADIKLSANKLQQAILDAVTGRVKEFMLYKCSGARWGGVGSTEVEKAFSRIEIPIGSASSDGAPPSLKFYNQAGDIPTSFNCSAPVGPAPMDESNANSGQYLRFCMTVDPPGHPAVAQRLLELLVVPINLASDSAITCQDTRGPGAGVKVTWQMHNKINKDKVRGSGDGVSVLKESGTFLISAETESYSGTCNVTATRQGATNQCTVNVSGLGRRPPTLFKTVGGNSVAVSGITWVRAASANNDSFTTPTLCETNQTTIFRAQSAAGSDVCDATPVAPSFSTCKLVNKNVGVSSDLTCGANWCNTWRDASLAKGIVLPDDATNISLKVSDVHVDDWSPYISINGQWLVKYDEANLAPRTFTINKDISTWVKPGINVVYVGAWNKHTFWTTYFILSGSYQTVSGCNHEFRYFNGTSWVSQNN